MPSQLYDSIEIHETIDGVENPRRGASAAATAAGDTGATAAQAVVTPGAQTARKPRAMNRLRRPDPYLWGIYLMILLISVVELFSASSAEVTAGNVYTPLIRHAIFLGLGLAIVLWLQRTPYVLISKLSWVFAVLSLGLLFISSIIGVEINGAQRAIRIAGMTIQPAEIVKLSVVCLLATILGRSQRPGGVSNRGVFLTALVVVVFCIFLWRNGLTNMLLLMCVSLAMMIIGGIQWKKLGLVLAVYAVGVGAIYLIKQANPTEMSEFDRVKQEQAMLASASGANAATAPADDGRSRIDRSGTRKNRIKNFLRGVHPEDEITDENRQVMMAKFAQANGGIFGQGPGNSRESARLPLAFSDYIYSIIVEDTGLAGGTAVLFLFLILLARAGRIAFKCSRAIPAFLILGCAVMIVFQALVHMAIVTGLFPVSGQPLPFISKGGTSVLVMSAAMGIMMSVARFASFTSDGKAVKAELNALPEDMQAGNYSAQMK